jgi:hypothetical protein
MDPQAAARRVGVLAGQLVQGGAPFGRQQHHHEPQQLARAACAAAAAPPKRSKLFDGQVICITGAAKVRVPHGFL